jgi:beta-phosphoglucomutase-like phosphatase (HAD superfamily)
MKTVIFDMDGLLVDSEVRALRAWREVAERHGFCGIDELFPKMIGMNTYTRGLLFAEVYGKDFPFLEYNEEVRTLAHGYEAETPIPLKKGARELLFYFRENGYRTAIASSGLLATIERRMKYHGIFEYFDVIVSGDMVTKSKPDPEIFLLCAERLGVDPAEITVLEDSENGIKAAHAAGMRPVMVPDLAAPEKDVAALAYSICSSLFEVKEKYESGDL